MKDLFDAIKEQDLDKVKGLAQFITDTAEYNITQEINGEKHTPLTYAISLISSSKSTDNLEIVNLLLKNGADPDFTMLESSLLKKSTTPLELAVVDENIELMTMLLSYQANADENVLKHVNEDLLQEIVLDATEKSLAKDLQITETILKAKGSLLDQEKFIKTIMSTILEQSPEIAKPFFKLYIDLEMNLYPGFLPLITQYRSSKTPKVVLEFLKIILDLKTNPNLLDKAGSTPLIYACNQGTKEIIRLLLENGADPNIADREGSTPLKILISYDNPFSPLSEEEQLKMIKLLIEKRVKLDEPDKYNNFPIHYAIENNKFDIVKFLLEKTPDLRNLDKRTLALLDQADPRLLLNSGIIINNKFTHKVKVIEQESTILTKLINLINEVKLFFEETLYNTKKFLDESSVDNSHITVSLVDSLKPTQGESLPNQPNTFIGKPTQNSNEQSK